MSLQLHSLLIACGGFTRIMHTYPLSPISPPLLNPYVSSYTDGHRQSRCQVVFFKIYLSIPARGLAKRLCTSPWNQGHLWGRSKFFCRDELPPSQLPLLISLSFWSGSLRLLWSAAYRQWLATMCAWQSGVWLDEDGEARARRAAGNLPHQDVLQCN